MTVSDTWDVNLDPQMWLKDCGENYECIAVCANDLLIASKDPQNTVDPLENKHHFKIKGTGPMSYHLGCDFVLDEDGTLNFEHRKHVENMEE